MADATYFDTLKKNFTQVPIAPGTQYIETASFLEATEGLINMFDLLQSAAFKPVVADMTGNVKKIREKFLVNPAKYASLQEIMIDEKNDKKKTATEGTLWLKRGLEFTARAMRLNVSESTQELSESFTKSYEETLKQYHNMLVRPVFTLAMKACPYRKDFYEKLGKDQAKVSTQMNEWLGALENILNVLNKFWAEGGY
ncbi:hypothetical protein RI367_001732 [Sorochytrium milnesiophthora]